MAKNNEKKIEYGKSARERKAARRGAEAVDSSKKKEPLFFDHRAEPKPPKRQEREIADRTFPEAESAAESETGTAAKSNIKRNRIIAAVLAGIALVALITGLLLWLFQKTYPTDGAYASFHVKYEEQDYHITYQLTEVDTSSKGLGELVGSFISWTNLGVYNGSVLHKFDPHTGSLMGGEYRDYHKSRSDGFSATGTKIMTRDTTKDKSWHDYYYEVNFSENKNKDIGEKYNLSMTSNNSSYRWYYQMCIADSTPTDTTGWGGTVIGRALESSKKEIDRLYAAVVTAGTDMTTVNRRYNITPAEVVSVSISGNRFAKWHKYTFFQNHTKDDYKRI